MDQENAEKVNALIDEMSKINAQIEVTTTSLAKECKQAVHLADEIGTPVYAQFATGVTMISGEERLYVEFQALRLLELISKYRTLKGTYDKIKLVVNLDLRAVGENMATNKSKTGVYMVLLHRDEEDETQSFTQVASVSAFRKYLKGKKWGEFLPKTFSKVEIISFMPEGFEVISWAIGSVFFNQNRPHDLDEGYEVMIVDGKVVYSSDNEEREEEEIEKPIVECSRNLRNFFREISKSDLRDVLFKEGLSDDDRYDLLIEKSKSVRVHSSDESDYFVDVDALEESLGEARERFKSFYEED